jgi:hypothetical protein
VQHRVAPIDQAADGRLVSNVAAQQFDSPVVGEPIEHRSAHGVRADEQAHPVTSVLQCPNTVRA